MPGSHRWKSWKAGRFPALIAAAALGLRPQAACADADADLLRELRQQMRQMQQQMNQIEQKIEQVERRKGIRPAVAASPEASAQTPAPGASPAGSAVSSPAATASAPAATGTASTAGASATTAAASAASAAPPSQLPPWLHGQPLTVASAGSSYMNISFDTIVDAGTSTDSHVHQLQLGDHDPDQRGFSLRNAELAVDGAVDPYFKAFANVVFKLDDGNETEVELEEAYGLSTSLPWNLQVKAGQYFAEFGRQNSVHPHAWAFVDEPLIMGRVLGGDGLRNVGARVSWLAPTPFYTELFLSIFNGEGGTAFSFRDSENTYGRRPVDRSIHAFSDLLFVPRIATSFDLTDTQTLVFGASGAFGPNDSGHHTDTEIYGTDLYWKWRPVRAQQGFPFVSSQTELMLRRYEAAEDLSAALPHQMLEDYGGYSQLLWGFRMNWVAGLRGEYVTANNRSFDVDERGHRTRISPNITWYPTEFSKLRLQYNYDHGQAFGDEHSVWLQAEFTLGAHGAHKF
ncbi:MAG TPA: hypothetical protein VN634_05395 [Candidatus Limnocylindrales bacterium]|nr:hypothetical protein [Candidatus Limnocylindrales bacterium]